MKDVQKNKSSKVKFGIRKKLMLGTLVPLVIVLVLVGIQLNSSMQKTVTTLNNNHLASETEVAAQEINAYFQRYIGLAEGAASSELVLNELSASNTTADGNLVRKLQVQVGHPHE